MNFYDEEIPINATNNANLSKVRVESLNGAAQNSLENQQETVSRKTQDIFSPQTTNANEVEMPVRAERPSAGRRSSRNSSGNIKKELFSKQPSSSFEATEEISDNDSGDDFENNSRQLDKLQHKQLKAEQAAIESTIDIAKIESLSLNQNVKELFRYILKYTPQNIDTPYQLQPFIPEYVPAVGDVDAFLKVTIPELLLPPLLKTPQMSEHLKNLGLRVLDEPSGAQSEPRLLNIKLNTVFSSNSAILRSAQGLAPLARNAKDIDKWISEVEQMHMLRSMFKAQANKDIDAIELNWPKQYHDTAKHERLQAAYVNVKAEKITLLEYVRELCNILEFENINELMPQTGYIQNIFTIFCLYLVTHKAWNQ